MTDKQYTAVVKDGLTYGHDHRHKGGDKITVTKAEVIAFGDKLRDVLISELITNPVIPPADPESTKDMDPLIDGSVDLSQASVDEIMAAIDSGWITAADAVAAEKERPPSRQRKSILNLVLEDREDEE